MAKLRWLGGRIAMQERITARRKALCVMGGLLPRTLSIFLATASVPVLAACGGAKIEAAPHADQRTPIELAANEADDLRAGMRVYLASIQGIVAALPRNKMAVVASEAKRAGMGMVDDIPASLVVQLPPGFVVMSMDTHQKFDALSRVAETSGTKSAVLSHLQDILANCTSCHATYRISQKQR